MFRGTVVIPDLSSFTMFRWTMVSRREKGAISDVRDSYPLPAGAAIRQRSRATDDNDGNNELGRHSEQSQG
jgi:hypothetical protein